jgi:hypothetical protein
MLLAAVEKYRPDLKKIGVTIDTLICENVDDDGETHDAVKRSGGIPVAGLITINSTKLRATCNGDALIQIDGHKWSAMTDDERDALMDDLIYGIEVQVDDDGIVELDDQQRPKIKLKPFEYVIAGYRDVAARHGEHSQEVIGYRHLTSRFGDVLDIGPRPARPAEPIDSIPPETYLGEPCGICRKPLAPGHMCSVTFKSEDFAKIKAIGDKLREDAGEDFIDNLQGEY